MAHISVQEESSSRLHLVQNPTIRSWASFVVLLALGFGAAYYSSTEFIWRLVYISGAVFLGLIFVDDWEECIFDKNTEEVTFIKTTVLQKIFNLQYGQRKDVASINNISDVSVKQGDLSNHKVPCYTIQLHFAGGYTLPVSDIASVGPDAQSNHEAVANKIRNFLQLEKPDVTLSDDSSDDGFEQIKHGELSGFNEQDIKHESVQSDRATESTDHDNPAPTTDIDA